MFKSITIIGHVAVDVTSVHQYVFTMLAASLSVIDKLYRSIIKIIDYQPQIKPFIITDSESMCTGESITKYKKKA